jgi:hypothetical protein
MPSQTRRLGQWSLLFPLLVITILRFFQISASCELKEFERLSGLPALGVCSEPFLRAIAVARSFRMV